MNKTAKVLAHLKSGKTITSFEAFLEYRATRLADIIFRLRNQGHKIGTEYIQNDNAKFARYRLTRK